MHRLPRRPECKLLSLIGAELVNTVTAKRELLENCRDPEYREALVLENVYTGLCSQIRVLREKRELSQAALGRKIKMAQERISILEDPNAETKPTLTTLLRVASGFDLGLDVRFVSFGTVLDRSVETNPEQLSVLSFDDELPALEKNLEEQEAAINRLATEHTKETIPTAATGTLQALAGLGNPSSEYGSIFSGAAKRIAAGGFPEYGLGSTTGYTLQQLAGVEHVDIGAPTRPPQGIADDEPIDPHHGLRLVTPPDWAPILASGSSEPAPSIEWGGFKKSA
jgi:transcriptional regulator with XRE-family HTH domain